MRLLTAICLLAAFVSGVLAQNHHAIECIPNVNNCLGTGTAIFAAPVTEKIPPSAVWVADPSAGHYDCPDGWTAYTQSEPGVYRPGGIVPAIYRPLSLDKKGHILNEQPAPPICLREKP